jgi:hypothetical protein
MLMSACDSSTARRRCSRAGGVELVTRGFDEGLVHGLQLNGQTSVNRPGNTRILVKIPRAA